MADRITQLQNYINLLAEHICNATGILQLQSPPIPFNEKLAARTDTSDIDKQIELFSTLITRTAKDIDMIIASLPSRESTSNSQLDKLKSLNDSNKKQGDKLEELILEGEKLLSSIRIMIDNLSTQLLCVDASIS